jgi:hypoxanthine phosphoribosyltransferase
MKSYAYDRRKGIRNLSWDDFASLGAHLAEQIERSGVEVVVGIARAGLFPAVLVACSLRKEMFPVRLTRRLNDEVVYEDPVWRTPLTADLSGKVVAVVDEIADTGQTLKLVADAARQRGAALVKTACLVSHTWADPAPDFTVLVTDELVVFPWDQRVLIDGLWQPHPEILAAIQAAAPSPSPVGSPKSQNQI